MDIILADGQPFAFVFPVFVLMRVGGDGKFYVEPVWYPGGSTIPVYTDEHNAESGIDVQQLTDMRPVPVGTEAELRRLIDQYERMGTKNVSIDACLYHDAASGHVVPIAVALGRTLPADGA